jgi:hypothetical protein
MGLFTSLKRALGFGGRRPADIFPRAGAHADEPEPEPADAPAGALDEHELARRLGTPLDRLLAFQPQYAEFTIPKRRGGSRRIVAPDPPTKALQRTILRRLLARLRAHPCATGFERGHSILTNARFHERQALVINLDIRQFFPQTRAERVETCFRRIGWNKSAARLHTRLVTHDGGLPPGAPTSPRLSNLVNFRMDARLYAIAARAGARYSRYADDMTFSFQAAPAPKTLMWLINTCEIVLARDFGYRLHRDKLRVLRRGRHQQRITGLVVNERARLPRRTRRWLRAVEHRHQIDPAAATLTETQLRGWRALVHMIDGPPAEPAHYHAQQHD